MKFLKISSLLVLSMLLFVPSVLAQVECEVRPNNQRIRMESEMEMLDNLTVRCTLTAAADITTTASATGSEIATRSDESMFDLELQFNGDLLNDDGDDADMPVTLMLMDADAGAGVTGEVDAMGYRMPAPMGTVDRDTVYWEDILFPGNWDGTAETFMIAGLYVDATSISDDRLEVSGDMIGYNLATDVTLDMDSASVNVARVDQALDLSFDADDKATFNSCEPGSATISVNIEEGYRMAWMDENDIMLMTSSGKISASDAGVFDVTAEGGAGELVIDVTPTDSDDSGALSIKFEPAAGGAVGDDVTLSAMILPARRTDESFAYSAQLVIGSYGACEGDMLYFPFVTSMTGWDTGIVVVNDSEVDGSCSLNWGNMDLDDDEMEALSTIDVDGKDHMAFLVSMQRGADYDGSLSVQCSFSGATGYVFLSDAANGIGQG
ncbi:MAG: hypothetical protein OXI93_08500, partial [Bryobacterales bacterium]|nr:hypothetical protein [Bryobacterales bacterium]